MTSPRNLSVNTRPNTIRIRMNTSADGLLTEGPKIYIIQKYQSSKDHVGPSTQSISTININRAFVSQYYVASVIDLIKIKNNVLPGLEVFLQYKCFIILMYNAVYPTELCGSVGHYCYICVYHPSMKDNMFTGQCHKIRV